MYDSDISLFEQFKDFKDEEIISLIHNGDELAQEYIIYKYKNFVRLKAHAYFIIGADKEDIIQEGMIGLYKAIRDFNPEKKASFISFAELCINRQIITAIKSATRQKHIPLNSSLSLNRTMNDSYDGEDSFIEFLSGSEIHNPEVLLIDKEEVDYIQNNIAMVLSKFELKVLGLYLKGISYSEIAKLMEKDEKSIDNALQRVRKKIEKIVKHKNYIKECIE